MPSPRQRAHILLGAGTALAVSALLIREFYDDALYWPRSAEERIEEMAEILQRLGAPARWCYPSSHPHNIAQNARLRLGACLTQIAPLGPSIEQYPRAYVKQFYGARIGSETCEVTLSTVWNDDRIVGADCYYGLFKNTDYQGSGMTDDPFG